MLSRTAEHALRAVLFLARQHGRTPLTTDVVAAAIGAPRNYLSKTMHQLAQHGVLASTRGPAGGFVLAGLAESLTVARVVELFDTPSGSGKCLLGDRPCDRGAPCAAHVRWTAITESVRGPLRVTTIADLLGADAPVQVSRPDATAPCTDGVKQAVLP